MQVTFCRIVVENWFKNFIRNKL